MNSHTKSETGVLEWCAASIEAYWKAIFLKEGGLPLRNTPCRWQGVSCSYCAVLNCSHGASGEKVVHTAYPQLGEPKCILAARPRGTKRKANSKQRVAIRVFRVSSFRAMFILQSPNPLGALRRVLETRLHPPS